MSNANLATGKKSRGAGCLRWLGRVALGGVILLLGLAAIGAIYQAIASAKDAKLYKPVDQMVDVNGIQMRLDCRGTGSPTVVLEAGAQSFGIHWVRIQDEVAKFTRVCSYDRAGFGWSEPVHEELAPQQVAEMLHALLENGGEGPPYLMAGHSLGGVFVRTFTAEYPDEVVGMVLVDSTHDNQNQQLPPVLEKIGDMQLEAFRINLGLCQTLAPVGLMRALKMMDAGVSSLVPEDEKEPVLAQMYRTGLCGAMMREANMMVTYFSQPRTLEGLGDIPLIVLSAERDAQEMYDGYENYPADILSQLSVEMMQGQVDAFYKLQDELATLSTRGEWIVVQESGHNIHLDQPEVVIDAIREVFEQVPR